MNWLGRFWGHGERACQATPSSHDSNTCSLIVRSGRADTARKRRCKSRSLSSGPRPGRTGLEPGRLCICRACIIGCRFISFCWLPAFGHRAQNFDWHRRKGRPSTRRPTPKGQPGELVPGWLQLGAFNIRSSQGVVFRFKRHLARALNRLHIDRVLWNKLGPRNTIETVFFLDETRFRLRL